MRLNGAGLPGTGNFELDPRFVNAATGDLHLTSASPCIDAGSPGPLPLVADFENDSRTLDGDLDGRLRLDMGADEFGPIHLEIQGLLGRDTDRAHPARAVPTRRRVVVT